MDMQKLAKVLAMAGSDNEAEALHALRTAKRMLVAEGRDFVDLAKSMGMPAEGGGSVLHDAIFDLRNEVRQLRAENLRLKQETGQSPPALSIDPALVDHLQAQAEQKNAEIDSLKATLADLKERDEILRRQVTDLIAEADDVRRRLGEAESRRLRSELENQQLRDALADRPPVGRTSRSTATAPVRKQYSLL